MDERNNHFDFDFTPIGQAIKKAREARGMTREELSGIIGYAPRHILRWSSFFVTHTRKSFDITHTCILFSNGVIYPFDECGRI